MSVRVVMDGVEVYSMGGVFVSENGDVGDEGRKTRNVYVAVSVKVWSVSCDDGVLVRGEGEKTCHLHSYQTVQ